MYARAGGRRLGGPQIDPRPRFDAVRAVGLGSEAYMIVFFTYVVEGGKWPWEGPTPQFMAFLAGLLLVAAGLLLSWRTVSILAWGATCVIASTLFDVPSFTLEGLSAIYTFGLGLALPLLILLEVILTMEGATARARVVFRPRSLLKAFLLSLGLLIALLLSFSYLPLLREYATSPESGTFQAAMIAGLATLVLAGILLAGPNKEDEMW